MTDRELEAAVIKYVEDYVKQTNLGFINHRTLEMRTDFKAGAHWQKGRETARILELLKEYPSDNGPYRSAQWWANWIEARLKEETEK